MKHENATVDYARIRALRINSTKPSIRVRRAMTRLTRGTWISGGRVHDIGHALARCAAPYGEWQVYYAAFPQVCVHVGMLNGGPPAWPGEDCYGKVFDTARRLAKKREKVSEHEFLENLGNTK